MTRYRVLIGIVVVVVAIAVAAVGVWAWTHVEARDDESARPDRGVESTAPSAPSTVAATTTTAPDRGPPYGVGVLHVTVVDPSRGVAARGPTPAAAEHALSLTIRYPTAGPAAPGEVPDAPARRGPVVLVLFAHGLALQDQTYPKFLHDLAAAGFVVADPEFPLSSGALPGPARSDPVEQANDVAFVTNQLLDPAARPAPLRTVEFAERFGVVGHSDGGITAAGFAANSCCADGHVGAAVVLAGALGRFSGGWFTTVAPPLLVMHGTADETNPVSSSRGVYGASPGPKLLSLVEGGSHIGAFEDDASRPAVVTLVADFLRAYVIGDAAAAARLDADTNVPGVIVPG